MDKRRIEREFVICECESLEHLMCFTYLEDEVNGIAFKYVTTSVRLKQLPFFKRLWHAIKYVFGHTSVYGDYDEFIISPDDVEKFKRVIKYLEKSE